MNSIGKWLKKIGSGIWKLVAPSVKQLARKGLDEFLKANIDEAFDILLDILKGDPEIKLDDVWHVAFRRLKERNQDVFDTWISRLLIDAYEHYKALQLRGELPKLAAA